ncbi:MAG: (2Fe-2S) ferredoxin domain-containing protein [Merismopediaceae bacterium]|nr:(2Fe-2S) ferredoxin domain-containing protein [Merismopediaceae bacterium]
MSKKAKSHTTLFILEGEFLGFIWQGKKCKFLQIATPEKELILTISKKARKNLPSDLESYQMIQIIGKSKLTAKTGKNDLKVLQINPLIASKVPHLAPVPNKVKLLICQKSGCQKKGSQKQRQAIEQNLEARGLAQSVIIQETGCLGKCSMAPNIVLMPGKQRLSGMKPDAIADLLANNQNN